MPVRPNIDSLEAMAHMAVEVASTDVARKSWSEVLDLIAYTRAMESFVEGETLKNVRPPETIEEKHIQTVVSAYFGMAHGFLLQSIPDYQMTVETRACIESTIDGLTEVIAKRCKAPLKQTVEVKTLEVAVEDRLAKLNQLEVHLKRARELLDPNTECGIEQLDHLLSEMVAVE